MNGTNESTTNPTHDAMIAAACKWWGEQMGMSHDMNAQAQLGLSGLAAALTVLAAPRPDASAAERVIAQMAVTLKHESITSRYGADLSVDYDPYGLLRDIIIAAGNPRLSLPYKTHMYLDWEAGVVDVAKGYGAPTVKIYPVEVR